VTTPEPLFSIWIPAVEAGLLPLGSLVAWADDRIARLDAPPGWLFELSLAGSADDLRRIRLVGGSATPGGASTAFDEDEIHVGFLYLAYEAGTIGMDRLLREAGDYADGRAHDTATVPECEAFYLLLNEIDGGGPTIASDRPLAERVRELFEPLADKARLASAYLPGGNTTMSDDAAPVDRA
jgi:hypothetical protein